MYYSYSTCMYQSIVHACTIVTVHACTLVIVRAWTIATVHACSIAIIHASCPIGLMHRRRGGGGSGGATPPRVAGGCGGRRPNIISIERSFKLVRQLSEFSKITIISISMPVQSSKLPVGG